MRKFLVLFLLLTIIPTCVILAQGKDDNEQKIVSYVSYVSYTVSYGDTLWKIASEYKNSDESVNEFIGKIKKYNNFSCDVIYKGDKLIIPVEINVSDSYVVLLNIDK